MNPKEQMTGTTARSADASSQPGAVPSPSERKRILVVDDEDCVTRMLKLNLEQTNEFLVQTENRGEAALRTAAEFKPDLILLDIMMPGIGGDQLAQLLRDSPATNSAKIVFLTALAEPNHHYSGPDRILSKPVILEDVLRCIHRELGA